MVGRRTMRRFAGTLACVVTAACVAACGSSGSSGSSSSKGPIKVAAIASVTGPAPFNDWATGATAFFNRLNKDGGIDGRKVDFSIIDDKGDPTQAASIARQEVGDGVVAFVGSISLSDCAVNRNYYKQIGIVSIDVGSDATCFNSPNIAPVNSGPEIDPLMQMIYAAEVLHKKKICVLGYNVPGETADLAAAIKRFTSITGITPALELTAFPLNGDQTPAIIKLKGAGCQAVSVSADLSHGVPFLKDQASQGLSMSTMQTLFGQGTYSEQFSSAVGSAGNGLDDILELAPTSVPAVSQMVSDFKASNIPVSGDAETGWTAAYVFAHVAEGMKGPITRKSLTAAFKSLTPFPVPTMGTEFSFGTASAHNPNQAGWPTQLENGQYVNQGNKWVTLAQFEH